MLNIANGKSSTASKVAAKESPKISTGKHAQVSVKLSSIQRIMGAVKSKPGVVWSRVPS